MLLKVTYDPNHDVGYVYLTKDRPKFGIVKHTYITNMDVNLDFDAEGRLIGVELLRNIHPDLKG